MTGATAAAGFTFTVSLFAMLSLLASAVSALSLSLLSSPAPMWMLPLPLVLFVLLFSRWVSSRNGRRLTSPRISSRRLPVVGSGQSPAREEFVTIAGRKYLVVDAEEGLDEPCPWCLSPLHPEGGEEVVRCQHPHCRRAGHRHHVEAAGACGGLCSVLG